MFGSQGRQLSFLTFWFCLFRSCYTSIRLPWWLRWWRICLQCGRPGFDPWVGTIPWRRERQPTPVLLPGKPHGQRSLVGCSPRGHEESDMTERLPFPFPLASLYIHSNTLESKRCTHGGHDYSEANHKGQKSRWWSSSWKSSPFPHSSCNIPPAL